MRGPFHGVLVAAAVLAAAACSSGTSTPAATAGQPQPKTSAAAKDTAARFFGLYSAGQFAAAWAFLPPSTRRAIPQATWVAVHKACPSAAAGLTFQIKNATVNGSTATVTYSLTGVGSAGGSATQAFTYSGGHWWLALADPGVYQHGSVKADIAAAKAQGSCAAS